MAAFEIAVRVGFGQCDPAGIVFYPRYLEMINLVVERWFEDALDQPFADMHIRDRQGVPTVRTEVDFRAPARLGEHLLVSLEVSEIKRASAILAIRIKGADGIERVTARHILAYVTLDPMKAMPWPAELRDRMQAYSQTHNQ